MIRRPPRSTLFPSPTLSRSLEPFAAAGASVFTFHPEATVHVQRQLAAARQRGMLAGLALNPASPLALAERSEEHTSELQSQSNLVCRLLLEKKKKQYTNMYR